MVGRVRNFPVMDNVVEKPFTFKGNLNYERSNYNLYWWERGQPLNLMEKVWINSSPSLGTLLGDPMEVKQLNKGRSGVVVLRGWAFVYCRAEGGYILLFWVYEIGHSRGYAGEKYKYENHPSPNPLFVPENSYISNFKVSCKDENYLN